ncbi:Cleavage and polyadenylation specificity factor subunit 3-I [Vitis vinifera]|uniref:Cleavage and polyadenylation specificity factor subunit 3-I n=1 Tax=Vitis vinifera TaxID=29760 RepID=A0A438J6J9_VITVI|nr:Cleavage and polyadenylation specificity factor subunit 3-I [Vitis vinifera]
MASTVPPQSLKRSDSSLTRVGDQPIITPLGMAALPYFNEIDPSTIDVLLVTHFHLDHAASLPYFLEKTTFKGRVFMTHAMKAIYKLLLSDYVKVSKVSVEDMLYDEQDILRSTDKIEVIDFHQTLEVNGIRFWCYTAGHVLGAAMFMFSPDICIIESTYGVQLHQPRHVREKPFMDVIHSIISQGDRVLIPAYALGCAQELLLILDEYWSNHPELHNIPIYCASPLQKDPPVVMASPSGLSRQLFDMWCFDKKNACVIPGSITFLSLLMQILHRQVQFKIKNPPDSLTPLLLGYLPEGCNNQILLESARVVRTIVQTHNPTLTMSFFNPSFESQTPTQITSLPGSSYSLQMLNHVLPVKLDKSNYILWRTQMKNVIFTNGFEDHIEGLNMCPTKMTTAGTINPEFISWRSLDDFGGDIFSLLQSRRHYHWKTGLRKRPGITDTGRTWSDYNPIVASITTREDSISIYSIHNILLTHEQRNNRRISGNRNNYQNARPNLAQPQSRGSSGNRNQGFKQHQDNIPQYQLCGKYRHIAPSCYHRFDINFQGSHLPHTTPSNNTFPNHNSNQVQAMTCILITNLIKSPLEMFADRNSKIIFPKNCQSVEMYFNSEKMAKSIGRLAEKTPGVGETVSGLLVKKEFTYQIMAPDDLHVFSQLSTTNVTQGTTVPYL